MEEETIVINDLLSFAWCKLRLCSASKDVLQKCVEGFYSKECALEALETLLLLFPSERVNTLNPVQAIFDLLERLSKSEIDLPVFVCKDLNNVPNIDEVSFSVPEEKGLYKEHETIKSELSELCGSLHQLKRQLKVMTDTESNGNEKKSRLQSHSFHSNTKSVKNTKEPIFKTVSRKKSHPKIKEIVFDDNVNDEWDGEQQSLLIANRYQRAHARHAERVDKDVQFKSYKPLLSKSSEFIGTLHLDEDSEEVDDPPTLSRNAKTIEASNKVKIEPRSLSCSNSPSSNEDGAEARAHTCIEDPLDEAMEESDTVADPKSYSCSDCDVTFKTIDALNIHKMCHFEMDYRCPLCTSRFPEDEWLDHVRGCHGNGETKREDHHCAECDVYFGEKKLLGYHAAYHDDSRPFQCLECKYRFYTQKAVDGHFKMHSNKDYRYKCPFCNLRTPRMNRIKEHIRCHTGDKPFKCHLCSYATTTYDTLKGHQRSHSQNREFKCSECDKKYKSKNKLRFHERVHAKEKVHKCPVCGRGFNYGMCMTLHYRRHLGETTHDCPECKYKGCNGNELRKHMSASHPKKLPYKCNKCDFGAKFKSYLTKHRKEVHPKKTSLIV